MLTDKRLVVDSMKLILYYLQIKVNDKTTKKMAQGFELIYTDIICSICVNLWQKTANTKKNIYIGH